MEFNVSVNFNINVDSPNFEEIIKKYQKAQKEAFNSIVNQVLLHYANQYMEDGTIAELLNCSKVTWKTSKGNDTTTIYTIFGEITLPQLQVKNNDTGKRHYITRLLLGIKPRIRIPEITVKMLGLIGSLASYRVVTKIASMFTAVKFSLMTILRCVRKTGKKINFEIDENEKNEFEADGTGVPIIKAGKKGKELKVLAQRKKNGGIRIAGMEIGNYKSGWDKLFSPIKGALKRLGEIFLITDGDVSILNGIEGIKVILQRCLFHMVHGIKYTLWEDKVKKKSKEWRYVVAKMIEITNIKRVREEEGVAQEVIKNKKEQLEWLIEHCHKKGYEKTARYLLEAKGDIFSGIEKRIMGGTISLLERVMRTINMRINVGEWSSESALAVAKIRGAYYYNGFDI